MCNTCEVQLLLRPFYVFPCGHKFHSDCLVAALTPMLSMDQRTKLADLQRQLTAISNRPEDTSSLVSVSLSTRDQIKADIDELVASECLYCGELMIEYVFECLKLFHSTLSLSILHSAIKIFTVKMIKFLD